MKNDLTCGVVRDLLPSYVEGLTSPESNTAVERHLSECPDCAQLRTALAGAPKQAAPEDAKEVDYLKKVKRRGWRRVAAAVAVTVLLFHSYLAHTSSRFLDNLNRALSTMLLGLLVFYGANELIFRVCNVLFNSRTNLNDMTIAAQVASAPRMTALIVVLLAPFVEEVLFRGLVFGCLKEKSRIFAYILSCALFAFLHVWTAAVSNWDLGYLILMLQYLVPGLVFAWAYEHSGTLWTSILLHMLVNALSLFTIAS